MWGGGEIDLREARFESAETVIRCFTIMGGMGVTVPPELTVRVRGFGLMGGFGDRATGEGTPGSPRVTVTGFALMGGIGVERKQRKTAKRGSRAGPARNCAELSRFGGFTLPAGTRRAPRESLM